MRAATTTSFLLLLGVALASPEPVRASTLRRTAIVRAVEQARPSVVNIHGRKTVRNASAADESQRQVNGMGTGVVIDERGYILTNYHVVDSVARIQVTLHDDRTVIGQLVAHDPKTDLAIIKVDLGDGMKIIPIGTSSDLMIGESVIAVGNAYGYPDTVTRGIISALHRSVQVSDDQEYHDLIQTDASINPGNSGGPLLNIDGDMIGINVAVRVGAQGIGFAIPVDEALDVSASLISDTAAGSLQHGLVLKSEHHAESEKRHCVVHSVVPKSTAERAGLRHGDVIESVEDRPVVRALDFQRALIGREAGDQVRVAVRRGEESLTIMLPLEGLSKADQEIARRTWDSLGLKLTVAPRQSLAPLLGRYNGGLRIVSVRPDSPAAKVGIRTDDILVGMHKWETISLDNIVYILGSPDFKQTQPAKFYIVRNGETLFGHIRANTVR